MTGRWLLLGWIGCGIAGPTAAQAARVAVVSIPDIPAYKEAIEGIREQIPNAAFWDARDERRLRDNLATEKPALAIAVGSDAANLLDRIAAPHLLVVRSVVLEWDLAQHTISRPPPPALTVEMDPATLLGEIHRLFPGMTRIGVIRGPLQTDAYMRNIEQAARQLGFTLQIRDCFTDRELIATFLQFRSVEFVWCPPNPQLYNSATLKPLLLASITERLPLIGFSAQFVQAGALFGGEPDFRDVGRQTATVALRLLQQEAVPAKLIPRKFRFAYNQRVARMVGVKAGEASLRDPLLEVIR